MSPELLATIQQSGAIPSIPRIATRLLELTRDPDYNQGEVVELLASDPGLAGDLLRLANSALFGMTRKVGSLRQAITLLGMRRTRTLVMGRCMIARLGDLSTVDTAYYWLRSLTTGALAARLADQALPERREEAFLAGLLSDIGVIVLARAFGDRYRDVARRYPGVAAGELPAMEIASVGVAHAEVSALVLERWMLPESLVSAVRCHHDRLNERLPDLVVRLAGLVRAAAEIGPVLCNAVLPQDAAGVCESAMRSVSIPLSRLPRILHELQSDTSELAGALRIAMVPAANYETLIHSLESAALGPEASVQAAGGL